MTNGIDRIIPICHDDDNDGVDTSSGSGVAHAAAQGIYCSMPTNLNFRDEIIVQFGGFSRDYSAAGEGGFGLAVLDHSLGTLNSEETVSTTSYNLDADILSKQFTLTPHADLLTHATSTKKQCFIGTRKSIAVNSRMTAMGLLAWVFKGS